MYRNKIMAVLLVTFIGVIGFFADIYFVRYEMFDEMNSNYEFVSKDDSDISLAYTVNFPLKTTWVDLNGLMRNIFCQRTMNGVVKLNNGHIIIPQNKFTVEQTQFCAEQIIKYANYCKSQESDFVYIQPPINISEEDKQLPVGIEDYRNENVDGVIEIVEDAGVKVIDLRQCMKADGMNIYDYVYRTDHHWNTRGAFYGFQHITYYLEKITGITVDSQYTDFNNYRVENFKNQHLGSTGQRVGRFFAGVDDYEMIIPNFETKLSNGDGNIYSFEQIAVNWDIIDNKDVTNRYTYDNAFCNGWTNTDETIQISALIVSDSYFTPIDPFMSLVYNGYSICYWQNGLSADEIKERKPEIVIFMPYIYNSENLIYNPPTDEME